MNKAYECITDRIIALLEQGTVPWQKPWKIRTGLPRNAVSQKPYRGINVFLLLAMGYESPVWLTFRQASELGASVRKGEKACPVVFWKQLKIEDEKTEGKKRIPLLRFYHVFNVAQCEGLASASAPCETLTTGACKPDEILARMPEPPVIQPGMRRACYIPREDRIEMPPRERFDHDGGYYSTLFHELIHSTGHEKRLKRTTLTESMGYGTDRYCREELIAEMGAAFLCGQAEIVERTIDCSSSYIQHWLEQFKSDKALIIQAAAQAQKAADFVLGRKFEESEVEP